MGVSEYETARRLGNAVARAALAFASSDGSVRLCAPVCARSGCGRTLEGRSAKAIYCSGACRAAAARERAAA